MEDWKKSFRFTSAVSRHTDYHLIQPDLVELELVPRTRNLVHSRKSFVETFAILRGYLGFCLFQRGVRDGPCNFPNLEKPFPPSILITLPRKEGRISHFPHNRREVVLRSIETRDSSSSRFDQKCDPIPGTGNREQFWILDSFERVICSSRFSPSSPRAIWKIDNKHARVSRLAERSYLAYRMRKLFEEETCRI